MSRICAKYPVFVWQSQMLCLPLSLPNTHCIGEHTYDFRFRKIASLFCDTAHTSSGCLATIRERLALFFIRIRLCQTPLIAVLRGRIVSAIHRPHHPTLACQSPSLSRSSTQTSPRRSAVATSTAAPCRPCAYGATTWLPETTHR